ncbi:hypothetical protein HMPREF0793_0421 [Staphylococcus caprae M23864:W1]|nr:hypothetical protein HMPREF0793_0421 [Staphylococcus caprae M23864:W1]
MPHFLLKTNWHLYQSKKAPKMNFKFFILGTRMTLLNDNLIKTVSVTF